MSARFSHFGPVWACVNCPQSGGRTGRRGGRSRTGSGSRTGRSGARTKSDFGWDALLPRGRTLDNSGGSSSSQRQPRYQFSSTLSSVDRDDPAFQVYWQQDRLPWHDYLDVCGSTKCFHQAVRLQISPDGDGQSASSAGFVGVGSRGSIFTF